MSSNLAGLEQTKKHSDIFKFLIYSAAAVFTFASLLRVVQETVFLYKKIFKINLLLIKLQVWSSNIVKEIEFVVKKGHYFC